MQDVVDLLKRPYQPGDAPALANLLNLIDTQAGGHAGYTAPEVDTMISTMARDLVHDTSLWFSPEGELIAAVVNLAPPPGGYRMDLEGGVHPQWRGRGIGRELLAGQFARAEAIHVATGATSPWEVRTGALAGNEDAQRLFRRFGMAPLRYWFEMVAVTAQPVSLPVPVGLRVESYRPDVAEALYQAHTEAFKDHFGYQRRTWEQWQALSVGSAGFLADLSRLAFDGEDLAGYVLSYRDADPSRLYLGQVGTRRPWRRKGVAAGLLAEVIAAAEKAGFATAGLGVDADSPTGAVGVYERVGFAVESRAVTYSRQLPAAG